MKATGIVRRIDELGRVVIPKEIRRTQRIRRGDPLEIFTTGDGEVIFKKYSPIGEMNAVAAQYTEVLSKSFALTALVADRDRILTVSGSGRRELADRSIFSLSGGDRSISQPLEKLMDGRRLYQSEGIAEKCILPCEGSPRAVLCAAPIIAAGDVTGVVALLTEDRTATPDAAQLKAVNVAAAFLARQMEE
jgi:AbrB family transcriptional regulator (stage V sporulation protein T)